jgi:ABC-type polysaccharide/polyol phosphate export permease
VVKSAFTSALAAIVMILLFLYVPFMPKVESLWVPLYLVPLVPFTVGVSLAASSVIIQMRDLNQVVPIFLPLLMFLTPVIWPFSKIPTDLQPLYSFVNPIGPVINDIRGSVLSGLGPQWGLLACALAGAMIYMVGGYALFKRLEVSFADLA